MSRKKILFFADWFEPGYKAGGPIRSVSNMVSKLSNYHDIYVVTRITDFGSDIPYDNVEQNKWVDYKGVKVKYLKDENLTQNRIEEIFEEIQPEFIHLNSMYSKLFTLLPLKVAKQKRVKVVLAPRGMLGEGALKVKPLKKKLFFVYAKFKSLYNEVIFHASTENEKKEILKKFPNSKVKVALNLVDFKRFEYNPILENKPKEFLNLVYLSRVSPIKNLKYAIESVLKSKPKREVKFNIYGPIEDERYWEECQSIIENTDLISINYKGEVEHKNVQETFSRYHCLILPTLNENFGHVFIESWSVGCAVLISNNTPWKDLESKNVGWNVDLTQQNEFSNIITELSKFTDDELISLVKSSVNFANQISNDETNIKNNLNLFHG